MNTSEGQTAPESTRGFFDLSETNRKCSSVELAPRNTTYRTSLLSVNEESTFSRADALAEAEAKLTRRLSEPNRRNPDLSTNNSRRSLRLSTSDPNRKTLFVPHLPFSSVFILLKKRILVSGILRVNRCNRSNAYVFSEELNSDIYVYGSRDRNRALEGDRVALKLIQVQQILMEKREKEEAKIARNHGQTFLRKPEEEDEKEIVFDGEDDVELVPPKYCGTVVAILERSQSQLFSGTLGLTRPNHKKSEDRQLSPRIIWFKPTDKRVPLVAIPAEQAPSGFIENPDEFENSLFQASIQRWPITSLHPFGVLERHIGTIKDLGVQLEAILIDNNVSTESIESSEMLSAVEKRLDLCHLACFTLAGLQNALSIEYLTGLCKVGLHVSDVSALVPLNSALDKEARARGVSVDAVLEKIPLWPKVLLEQTELTPNQDKNAISVIWTIAENSEILDTWIGKTTIHSSMVLTEKVMEEILDFHSVDEESTEADVLTIYSIACLFHAKRNLIKTPKLEFKFVDTVPTELITFQSKAIFEEFQLLASTYVAKKIASHFPEQALLVSQARHHEQKMQRLIKYLSSFGYMLDPVFLADSIDAMPREEAQYVIRALVVKCQPPELYLSSGADISRYFHHGLCEPLYTHFVSPLSRYTDFIVQHQLQRALLNDSNEFPLDVGAIASSGNIKNHSSLQVLESTRHLFLSCYLSTHIKECDAVVVGVQENAIDVMVLPIQLERRIHTAYLPITSHFFELNKLHLIWQKADRNKVGSCKRTSICELELNEDQTTLFPEERRQVIRPFDVLKVSIKALPMRNPPLIRVLAVNPF